MNSDVHVEQIALASLYFDRVVIIVPPPAKSPISNYDNSMRTPGKLRDFCFDLRDLGIVQLHEVTREDLDAWSAPLVEAIQDTAPDLRQMCRFNGAWPVNNSRTYTIAEPWYSASLAKVTLREDLAFHKVNFYHDEAYLRTGSAIGRIYFSSVIEKIADRVGGSPISTDNYWLPGASEWPVESIADVLLRPRSDINSPILFEGTGTGLLALLAIKTVAPKASEHLSANAIEHVRTNHREQLTSFQDYISSISSANLWLSNQRRGIDKSALNQLLSIEYDRHIQPGLEEIERSLNRSRIDTVWSSLSIKTALPSALAAMLSTVHSASDLMTGMAIGGGAALGLLKVAYDYKKNIDTIKGKIPDYYLMSLRNETPAHLLSRTQSEPIPQNLKV